MITTKSSTHFSFAEEGTRILLNWQTEDDQSLILVYNEVVAVTESKRISPAKPCYSPSRLPRLDLFRPAQYPLVEAFAHLLVLGQSSDGQPRSADRMELGPLCGNFCTISS